MSDISFQGTTPRQTLENILTEVFPDWLVIPSEAVSDSLSSPTILIKQRTIAPLDAAPIEHFTVGFLVTVVDDSTDMEQAEDSLDTNVLQVWAALSDTRSTTPKQATKVAYKGTYLAYDIETDLTVRKG